MIKRFATMGLAAAVALVGIGPWVATAEAGRPTCGTGGVYIQSATSQDGSGAIDGAFDVTDSGLFVLRVVNSTESESVNATIAVTGARVASVAAPVAFQAETSVALGEGPAGAITVTVEPTDPAGDFTHFSGCVYLIKHDPTTTTLPPTTTTQPPTTTTTTTQPPMVTDATGIGQCFIVDGTPVGQVAGTITGDEGATGTITAGDTTEDFYIGPAGFVTFLFSVAVGETVTVTVTGAAGFESTFDVTAADDCESTQPPPTDPPPTDPPPTEPPPTEPPPTEPPPVVTTETICTERDGQAWSITYEVVNGERTRILEEGPSMPCTGGAGFDPVPWAASAWLLLCVGTFVVKTEEGLTV